MRIVAVESSVVRLPFDIGGPTPRFAGKLWDRLEILLVRVQTDAAVLAQYQAGQTHCITEGATP